MDWSVNQGYILKSNDDWQVVAFICFWFKNNFSRAVGDVECHRVRKLHYGSFACMQTDCLQCSAIVEVECHGVR